MNTLEIAETLIRAEIEKQREHWPMGDLSIEVEEANGFVFGCFSAPITNSSNMGRYGLYCMRGFEFIYSDSNVIDVSNLKSITIYEAIARTKAYFNHIIKNLPA